MCQMSVVLEKEGSKETIMENASLLEVTPKGVLISTLFEEAKLVPHTKVSRIDFLDGLVTITPEERTT